MKILFIAAEAVPFVKTGGLADVIGSLPGELRKLGIDARVIIPNYGQIPSALRKQMVSLKKVTVNLGWRYQYCELSKLEHNGVPFYFVGNDYYYNRDSLYGFSDDAERFAFFSRAVLESLPSLDFVPQILHCHDWHTGPVSVYLHAHYGEDSYYQEMLTLFTVHNLFYQGLFPREVLKDIMELGNAYFSPDKLEFYGKVSYLKGGLIFSDYITTVSPTYALEIQTAYYGEGLEGVLQQRNRQLSGIINGIDCQSFNPATDPHIFVNYRNSLSKKQQNKLQLQEQLGLPRNPDVPLIAFINRLVEQKGVDLIIHVLEEEMMSLDLQLVFLGTGEQRYESILGEIAARFPQQLSVNTYFDESLARRIYAGSDFFLLPALFEPCGIGQLIALRYGTIPVVRKTGGLKDTVFPYDETTGEGNGFTFTNYNAHDMLFTLKMALDLYENKKAWGMLVKNALRENHGWDVPAREYEALYRRLVNQQGV